MLEAAYAACCLALGISVALALALAIRRQSMIYDRILALNYIGTTIVIFIAVAGFFSGRPEFLDISITYALINFIGTIAILKFLHPATTDQPLVAPDTEETASALKTTLPNSSLSSKNNGQAS